MTGITDIHTHILPGVDDGSRSSEQTEELLTELYRQGVRTVILTPHYEDGIYTKTKEELTECLNQVKAMMKDEIPDLNLYIGNEIYFTDDVPGLLSDGRLCTLAGSKYVLTEFAVNVNYDILKNSLYRILLEGFIPVLAHVERYDCLYKKISLVEDLVNMGAYIQVNTESVTKNTPRRIRKFVNKLIDNDLLHIIASDTHDMKHRKPQFNECIALLRKKYNDEYIKMLLIDNPDKIIHDIYI